MIDFSTVGSWQPDEMSADTKEIVNLTVNGQESLRLAR
jgi:hypothetical protein